MEIQSNRRAISKMALVCAYISIITLNVNGLNLPFERYGVVRWIKTQDPTICCLQETHFRFKDTHRLKP